MSSLTDNFEGASIATCSMTFNHHGGTSYTKAFGGQEITPSVSADATCTTGFDPSTLG